MLTKEQYLRDPCGSASIPYWKQKSVVIPKNMRIIHENEYDEKATSYYADEPYFRLYHDLKNLTEPMLPVGFSVRKASLSEFAAHINSCYDKIGVSETELQDYTERPVYAESLWLAVQDDKTGEIVATAIGELDSKIGEAVLEWVQVSENYRHHGLGCFLVSSLLQKMKDTAHFATVSGQCNNPSDPEKIYRKCGFIGNDVWHILHLR